MRRWAIGYSVIAAWTSGWLTARFGFLPAFFVSLILMLPAAFAWRTVLWGETLKRREYAYLGLVSVLALVATAYVVEVWHDYGWDRRAAVYRNYHRFRRRVSSLPEYGNVRVSHTRGKLGGISLHGHVANKEHHDRLLEMLDWMVISNGAGYSDDVDYPGKPSKSDETTAVEE